MSKMLNGLGRDTVRMKMIYKLSIWIILLGMSIANLYLIFIRKEILPLVNILGVFCSAVFFYISYKTMKHILLKQEDLQQLIHQISNYDNITGLPNRTQLQSQIETLLKTPSQESSLTLFLVDLDGFKDINDGLSYSVGNEVLKIIGKCLKMSVPDKELVYHLASDEFAVLICGLDCHELQEVANRILHQISIPFEVRGHFVRLTASMGVACTPKDGIDTESLLTNADTAMQHAKATGKNRAEVYRPYLKQYIHDRLILSKELGFAIENCEFCLHYQPRMHLIEGIHSAEALIRWNHPERGLVFPGEFISVAEHVGLIIPIGRLVLEMACQQIRDWMDAGLKPIRVAVNVSGAQFGTNLVDEVERILKKYEIHPQWLEIEITESVLFEHQDIAIDTLEKLKKLGIHIAMDDFGTGYSSLGFLQRFRFDSLKIDRSFVLDSSESEEAQAIVSAIMGLGQTLGLQIIAEGVETERHLNFLKSVGCEKMQGYLFYPPLPQEQFIHLILPSQTTWD